METVKTNQFSELLSLKNLFPEGVETQIQSSNLIVTKWNWEYLDFLNFQKKAQEFIAKNRSLKIFIICNHPHLYTMGRGNERGENNLVEFNSLSSELPFPLHTIHRGGGITFHHPGQWIIYPIVAIKESYTLDDHMCWLLKSVAKVLSEDFKIDKVVTAKKLMGVWRDKRKLASIGVGVNRFVTEHGLALNLTMDERAISGLKAISPCGIHADTYTSVESIIELENATNILKSFNEKFQTLIAP